MSWRAVLSIAGILVAVPSVAQAEEANNANNDDDPVVHVRYPAGTMLPYVDRRRLGGWEFVCRAPCDQKLTPGEYYRVRGRTGNPSEPFVLPRAERVQVDAFVGSPTADVVGPVLVVGGLSAIVGGTTAIAWPSDGGRREDRQEREGRAVFGVSGIIIGTISMAVGLLVWHFGTTHASANPAEPSGAARSISTSSSTSGNTTSTTGTRWSGAGLVF